MIKQLTTYLDYSFFAELSLVMFACVFIAVVVRTLMTRSEVTEKQSQIVLDDNSNDKTSSAG